MQGSGGKNEGALIRKSIGIGGIEITGGVAIFKQGTVEVTGYQGGVIHRGDQQGDLGKCGGMILIVGDGYGEGIRAVIIFLRGIKPVPTLEEAPLCSATGVP